MKLLWISKHAWLCSFIFRVKQVFKKKKRDIYKLTSPNSQFIFLLFMFLFHDLHICLRQTKHSIKWKKAGLGWRNPEWCVLDTRICKRNIRWQNKWGISLARTRRQKQTRLAESKPDITLLWNKYNRYHVTKTVSTQYLTLSKIVKLSATDVSRKQTLWNSQTTEW